METEITDENDEVRRDVNYQDYQIEHQASEEGYQQHDESFSDVDGDDEFEDDEIFEGLENVFGPREDAQQSSLASDEGISADEDLLLLCIVIAMESSSKLTLNTR